MATIKAIEPRSVHQIQSGQVIVDLSSVVKELVENSLDAGASSIEIRFKNQGLDAIEVQDNGKGIAPEDFETVALKHYTSKLASYEDIDTLDTFGFRGEALSSMCALSKFHILTARAEDGAVGKRLDFEISGKLKSASVASAQKGTTVCVDDLFYNLPVRRRELEKNVKREYGKVLNYLYAYACISVGVRFTVSNTMPKGKRIPLFTTKANTSTKENIMNIFGAKTLSALVPLDLSFNMEPTTTMISQAAGQHGPNEVRVEGHISKPVFGEGRQAPDRQMFFVNSRPCLLPQITKVFNDVYRSFNVSQSPFIFANLILNTNAYDVNVSPDKRTILLHDQAALLDSLKTSLAALFETTEQTVPQASLPSRSSASHQAPSVSQRIPRSDESAMDEPETLSAGPGRVEGGDSLQSSGTDVEPHRGLIKDWATRGLNARAPLKDNANRRRVADHAIGVQAGPHGSFCKASDLMKSAQESPSSPSHCRPDEDSVESSPQASPVARGVRGEDRDKRSSDHEQTGIAVSDQPAIRSFALPSHRNTPGPVQTAFDRMRPSHSPYEAAQVTIGSEISNAFIGSASSLKKRRIHIPNITRASTNSSRSPLAARGLGDRWNLTRNRHEDRSEADASDQDSDDQSAHDDESDPESNSSSPGGVDESIASARRSRSRGTISDADRSLFVNDGDSDGEPVDEAAQRAEENGRVARLINIAEETVTRPSLDSVKRAAQLLKFNSNRKDSVLKLATTVLDAEYEITFQTQFTDARQLCTNVQEEDASNADVRHEIDSSEAENRLSLAVSKQDFGHMRVVGQFNLGFILAIRPPTEEQQEDDLFIIDQHAADEKFNFERLQRTVSLQSQRLVQPKVLELTAFEQEVILNNHDALKFNGFEVDSISLPANHIDDESATSQTQTFRLLTLPTSQQTTFALSDLEELIHLLSESGSISNEDSIPRPTKVRKMLAMRACRSSIMVGKTLTTRQMSQVVTNMGGMEKPWNCPHGRPTMRHLARMGTWKGWREGDIMDEFVQDTSDDDAPAPQGSRTDWSQWLQTTTASQ
jgi:DNA mismatch repair protein PMS2